MVASWRGLEIQDQPDGGGEKKWTGNMEQRVLEGEVKFRQSKPGPT